MRDSKEVFAQIEREIFNAEKAKVGNCNFTAKDVFCWKDKRFKKKKGLKKIFCFICSLFYTPAQNKQKFLEKEGSILRIIKEYSPKIKEQCINYEKYFFQWERENKSGGNNQWAIKKEREALENTDVLYKEEKEKIEIINEMIEFIHPMNKRLIAAREGWVSLENSLEYRDFLESFFSERIKKVGI